MCVCLFVVYRNSAQVPGESWKQHRGRGVRSVRHRGGLCDFSLWRSALTLSHNCHSCWKRIQKKKPTWKESCIFVSGLIQRGVKAGLTNAEPAAKKYLFFRWPIRIYHLKHVSVCSKRPHSKAAWKACRHGVSLTPGFHWAHLNIVSSSDAATGPELILVVLENARDSARCSAECFRSHLLCFVENARLIYC